MLKSGTPQVKTFADNFLIFANTFNLFVSKFVITVDKHLTFAGFFKEIFLN